MIDKSSPNFLNTPGSPYRSCYYYKPRSSTNNPFVSIITPFYNTPSHLFIETATSLYRQSFQQWEWIVINDGSTDVDALSALDKLGELNDHRIKIVNCNKNSGLSAARNIGFNLALSDYVFQIDSDDQIEPTALEKWVWGFVSRPRFCVMKGYTIGFGAFTYLWEKGFQDVELFLSSNPITATSLIKRETHRLIGGYDEGIINGFDDWDFWLRLATTGQWGYTIPEFHDWYRRKPNPEQRWSSWGELGTQTFLDNAKQKYDVLWSTGFPKLSNIVSESYWSPNKPIGLDNFLKKKANRVLVIIRTIESGLESMILTNLRSYREKGYELTLIFLTSPLPHLTGIFTDLSPDVFVLDRFLNKTEYPLFIAYILDSRDIDKCLISDERIADDFPLIITPTKDRVPVHILGNLDVSSIMSSVNSLQSRVTGLIQVNRNKAFNEIDPELEPGTKKNNLVKGEIFTGLGKRIIQCMKSLFSATVSKK